MSERRTESKLDWVELLDQALTAPGRMGDTYSRFYNYSYMNQVLLLMQGVREPVATYDRWRSLGRQVLRGSKAKEIVRPITVKREEDGEERTFTKFKPVRCLFTYSETTGEELPPAEVPGWDLDRALDNLDIKRVPFRALDGNIQGLSWDRNVAINPMATDPAATMFHEVGHVVLGHTQGRNFESYRQHRGIREFQAESTAYLAMHELDVIGEAQASESRAYIQGWLRQDRPSDLAVRQVFGATDRILRAGRSTTE